MLLPFFFACHEYDFASLDAPVAEPEPAGPYAVRDVTSRPAANRVDVLFVIDDSASMGPHQRRLADNLHVFADQLLATDVDFHVGVTTTDLFANDGRLLPTDGALWIDRSTPDPDRAFHDLARVGTQGSSAERGRAAAHAVLTSGLADGFERAGADLHVVFVSDEDDASGAIIELEDFVRWLRGRKEGPLQARAHAIVWPPNQTCQDGVTEGFAYDLAAARTGGLVGNLCARDWEPFLADLGALTLPQRVEIPLSDVPIVEPWSLQVTRVQVDGSLDGIPSCPIDQECEARYSPTRNTVVLPEGTLLDGERVVVDYLSDRG